MDNNREQIEEIKGKLDIVQVVERYVKLRKAGKNYLSLCPFHNEKTPSFIVSPDINRFKCFGCGKSGDIFNFVSEIEGLDFRETLEKLAAEAGIQLKKIAPSTKFSKVEELNEIAAQIFHRDLVKNANAQATQYIKKRGLSDESVKSFLIGYAKGRNSLLNEIRQKGSFSKMHLLDSGLFTEKNGILRDRFINRVMFPIRSSRGKVVGFTARQMPGDDFGPKYLNTPETPIFKKGELLFGFYEAKSEIRKEDYVVLVEGSMDVISAHAVGIKACVAPLGTGLTQQQVSLISGLTKNVLLLFDNDKAGFKAAERAFKLCSELGLNVYAATTPPPYKDIDELVQKDEKLAKRITKPKIDAFTHLLTNFASQRDFNSLKGYNEIIEFAKSLLSSVRSDSLHQYFARKLYQITKIKISKRPASKQKITHVPSEASTPKTHSAQPVPPREMEFLKLFIHNYPLKYAEKVNPKLFSDKRVYSIFIKLKSSPRETIEQNIDVQYFSKEEVEVLEQALFSTRPVVDEISDPKKELKSIFHALQSELASKRLIALRQELAMAESTGDTQKADRIIEEIKNLAPKVNEAKNRKI